RGPDRVRVEPCLAADTQATRAALGGARCEAGAPRRADRVRADGARCLARGSDAHRAAARDSRTRARRPERRPGAHVARAGKRHPARTIRTRIVRGTGEGSLGLLPPGSDPVRNLTAPRADAVYRCSVPAT